tara:strand:- start:1561 stop:1704 length:144 start_codon:yes stop_codon:yes gene_type:complete
MELFGGFGMKYKEAYNHATSIIAELQRENRRLKQLVAIAIMTKGEEE